MDNNLTEILVDIFRFVSEQPTAESKGNHKVSCLNLSSNLSEKNVDKSWDNLQQILFERLMIEDYKSCEQIDVNISINSPNLDDSLCNEFKPNDGQILRYLYGCYFRLKQLSQQQSKDNQSETLIKAERLILDQVILYLTEPDLFPDRDKRIIKNNQPAPLLLNLISRYYSGCEELHIETIQKFVNSIGEACKPLGDTAYDAILSPTYNRLSQMFVTITIDNPTLQEWFKITGVFLQQPEMAKKLLEKNVLKTGNSLTYQSTLLGFMLCISPLPRTSQNDTTFFKNSFSESEHKFTENQLGIKLQLVGQELHKIFHALLKQSQTRNIFLSWIGRCLHTFKDRKKLWSNQVLMATNPISVNDGFLMNFLTVMLHLSEPFAGPYTSSSISSMTKNFSIDKKMLKIDPRYCKWSKPTHENCEVHFLGLGEETFLVKPAKDSEELNQQEEAQASNFISECFFGTHQVFSYGFRSVYERFYKLAQNIHELQHAYQDAMAQSMGSLPMGAIDPREIIKDRIDKARTQFFNLKAVLMVPNRITMQLHFCVATAAYLNHLIACNSYDEAISATEFKQLTISTLQAKKISNACLRYIPEMLIENLLDFFLFLNSPFNDAPLSRASGILEPVMTMIITFMGNSSLIQNPHLRARFAEILESLMPHQSHNRHQLNPSSIIGEPGLFETHPLIDELITSLVSVFVSIEMTGEGVQFEQKFSYRRPMYVVLEYLWSMPQHRRNLINLAQEAETNINSARPPLFLRFVNLLMNDAIFLLDEALNFMNQLREAERRKKSEEWQKLTHQQRAQAESGYTHTGRLARFHNVLSLSTIGTIAWITSEIKTIFSHSTLVDRIANMLNYFLEHLVGPKKGKFNVNDKNDYEFKPKEVLEKICQIYINLGQADGNPKFREFCTAVSSDGRSYSESLLPKATDILFRTGLTSLGVEFEKLSQQVHEIAVKNQMDEIPTEDIPDTFLDPIMSTLMVDPVLLPSSQIIVDRSTIARHLLSDQTDPFNRSPLSMEDVIPEIDLKNAIECFLKERRAAKWS